MNPLHLLWIVPLSAMLGFLIASFCVVAGGDKRQDYRSAILGLVEGIQEEELEQGMYPSIEAALVDAVRLLSR